MFFGGVPKNGVRGRAPLSGVPEETPGGGVKKKGSFFLIKIILKNYFYLIRTVLWELDE